MEQDRSKKTEDQFLALSDAMESGTMQHARGMLNELSPAEIANLIESLPHTSSGNWSTQRKKVKY